MAAHLQQQEDEAAGRKYGGIDVNQLAASCVIDGFNIGDKVPGTVNHA